MDTIRPEEIEAIREIAAAENGPVLMVNCNRYRIGEYPDGELYRRWRTVNQQMLDAVDGKILWTLPVQGQPLINGDLEPLDEILAYWPPPGRLLVGKTGFEPATPCSQSRCATKLRHFPDVDSGYRPIRAECLAGT